MKKNLKVSIIIPFCNNEKTIKQCLESALNQTYENIEIVLVNDGSNDNSKDLCQNIIKKHIKQNIINYFEIENSGVSAARNYGIKKSKGDYITFLDSDDWLELDAVEQMIKIVEHFGADIVQSNLNKRYGDLEESFYNIKENLLVDSLDVKKEVLETIISYEFSKHKYKERYGPTRCAGGKLYNINIIEKMFETNIYLLEDAIFNYNAIENAHKIYIMKNSVYNYRITSMSASNKNSKDLLNQYENVLKKMSDVAGFYNLEAIVTLKFEMLSAYLTRILKSEKKDYFYVRKRIIESHKKIISNNELKNVKYKNVQNKKRISLFLYKNKLYFILYVFYYLKMKTKEE